MVERDYAVLDIQWAPEALQCGTTLAVASSTGMIEFFEFQKDAVRLNLICSRRICEPDVLVLSLTWHPFRANVLGMTLSDGRVILCQDQRGGRAWQQDADIVTTQVHQHELEAWTVAFAARAASEPSAILSGGDDVVLRCSRVDPDRVATFLWQDRRAHEAGVTAILPITEDLTVTGSYDDHIRLLAIPAVGRRQVLASLNLGGGVWKLKALRSPESLGASNVLLDSTRSVSTFVPTFLSSFIHRLAASKHGHPCTPSHHLRRHF